jgi:hypothetical protein
MNDPADVPMKSIFVVLLLYTLLCFNSHGQGSIAMQDNAAFDSAVDQATPGNGFDFFTSEELLQMTLRFDIRAFLKTKGHPEYVDALLTVKTSATDSLSQHIKIKARGDMRRTYCYFPPVMLKFKSTEQEKSPIQNNGTIKLVTHCNLTSVFENYVLKEYLAYKMYNLVTPYSFKTRLVKINYTDINKPEKSFSAYGFLIENEDNMAKRNKSVVLNKVNILQWNLNPADMARLAVFNYMIGNTDWSLLSHHNIKVMASYEKNGYKAIPVAYDFDYSGFVNTNYSAPAEVLPIKKVTDRYYLGLCLDEQELKPVIEEFGGLKDQFLSTVSDFDYLSNGSKRQAEAYINSFYKIFKYENYILYDLNRTCKKF